MILDELAAATRARVEKKKKLVPYEKVKEQAMRLVEHEKAVAEFTFPFEKVIGKEGINFICEVKRASPSKGMIAQDFPYLDIARDYENAGADCISVLTETDYFLGSDSYLKEIAAAVSIPVIRKDFLIDPYMIYEAKLLGASCVLLIASLLDIDTLRIYKALCDDLGISALIEVHDREELERAICAGARMIGVNNRDLKTFTVDINNSIKLRSFVPKEILFVAESGITAPEDIQALRDANVNGVLIGETLMKSSDKRAMLRALKGA